MLVQKKELLLMNFKPVLLKMSNVLNLKIIKQIIEKNKTNYNRNHPKSEWFFTNKSE